MKLQVLRECALIMCSVSMSITVSSNCRLCEDELHISVTMDCRKAVYKKLCYGVLQQDGCLPFKSRDKCREACMCLVMVWQCKPSCPLLNKSVYQFHMTLNASYNYVTHTSVYSCMKQADTCSIFQSLMQKLFYADATMETCTTAVFTLMFKWFSYFTRSFLLLPLSSLFIFLLIQASHYSPHFHSSLFCL